MDDGIKALRVHRAQRRQHTLNQLRNAARHSESAARLLAQVDPAGDLRFWPPAEEARPARDEPDGKDMPHG